MIITGVITTHFSNVLMLTSYSLESKPMTSIQSRGDTKWRLIENIKTITKLELFHTFSISLHTKLGLYCHKNKIKTLPCLRGRRRKDKEDQQKY